MIERSFYFLRHGETDENRGKVLQGHLDTLLNETGQTQASQAAKILQRHPIDRIVSSTLKRAAETAQIIQQILQKPITFHDDLRENFFGLFEGKTTEQINDWKIANNYTDGPIQPETGFAVPPEGESYKDMRYRVLTAIRTILEKHPTDHILFVSHGRVFGMLNLELLGQDSYSKNSQPYRFERTNEGWSLNDLAPSDNEVFCA
jgi:broad specificity phosphatase PhoE